MIRVAGIWRYPVKSMRGESLAEADLVPGGLLGDRAFALVDGETGRVASAKNPRRWPHLLDYTAAYATPPIAGADLPRVRVRFPDGRGTDLPSPEAEALLGEALGRPVRVVRELPGPADVEEFAPDLETPGAGVVGEFTARAGPFFDASPVLLVTTGMLQRLGEASPSRFDPRRFRPNFLLESEERDAESRWVGRALAVGTAVLRLRRACARCVMTTLAQEDLPEDLDVLRAVRAETGGRLGVYATVEGPGRIRVGDEAGLGPP